MWLRLEGRHANLKPRFTDAPWKMALFIQAFTQTRKMDVVLATVEKSVSEGNNREWSSEFWNGSFSREMYGRPTVVFCRSERDA